MNTQTRNAVLIDTILRSGICLNPTWGAAFELARLAERLPASIRDSVRVVPSSVQPALEAAATRASEVLAFNRARRTA